MPQERSPPDPNALGRLGFGWAPLKADLNGDLTPCLTCCRCLLRNVTEHDRNAKCHEQNLKQPRGNPPDCSPRSDPPWRGPRSQPRSHANRALALPSGSADLEGALTRGMCARWFRSAVEMVPGRSRLTTHKTAA